MCHTCSCLTERKRKLFFHSADAQHCGCFLLLSNATAPRVLLSSVFCYSMELLNLYYWSFFLQSIHANSSGRLQCFLLLLFPSFCPLSVKFARHSFLIIRPRNFTYHFLSVCNGFLFVPLFLKHPCYSHLLFMVFLLFVYRTTSPSGQVISSSLRKLDVFILHSSSALISCF